MHVFFFSGPFVNNARTFLQVEFANVILLNKADLAQEGDMATLEALVRRLNPAARIVRTVSSNVGLAEVLGTGEFNLEEASQAAGWVQVNHRQHFSLQYPLRVFASAGLCWVQLWRWLVCSWIA